MTDKNLDNNRLKFSRSNIEAYHHEQADGSGRKKKYLVFILGDERYCIPLSRIKEVLEVPQITPMPRAPTFFRGMLNLRGQVISVVDLRIKLGFGHSDIIPEKTCVIIIQIGDLTLGMMVDEVIEVVGYDSEEIQTDIDVSAQRGADAVIAVAKGDDKGRLTLIMDIDKALDLEDFKLIRHLNLAA